MSNLPLAFGIADAVSDAWSNGVLVDFHATAERLADEHPEADATRQEIVEALHSEAMHDLLD